MKVFLLLLLGISIFSAAPTKSPAEKEVFAAMAAYKAAYLRADGTAMAKLLDRNLIFVHSDGSVQDKAGFVKHISVGPPPQKMEFLPDTTVRIHEMTAFVTGHEDHWDKRSVIHMHVLHVWQKNKEGWQLIARQATLVDTKTRSE
jgi:hypothetical protein